MAESALAMTEFSKIRSAMLSSDGCFFVLLLLVLEFVVGGFVFFVPPLLVFWSSVASVVLLLEVVVVSVLDCSSSSLGQASTVKHAPSTMICKSFPTNRISNVPIRPPVPNFKTISCSIQSYSSSLLLVCSFVDSFSLFVVLLLLFIKCSA